MKPSERRLLVLFFVLVAVVAGLLGTRELLAWQKRLHKAEDRLEMTKLESQTLLAEAEMWNARNEWVNQTQPAMKDALEANQELTRAEEMARDRGLETLNRQLLEPETTGLYQQIGFTMTVKGPLPEVFRWLHRMQSPSDFRVIPSLKVAPDKQDPNLVVATVQVWRWYRTAGQSASAPGPLTAGSPQTGQRGTF